MLLVLRFLKDLGFFVGFFLAVALLLTLICRDSRHFGGISVASDKNLAHAFFNRMYFTVTTFTTIGLGDITPASVRARGVVMFIALVFLVVILQSLENIRTTVLSVIPSRHKVAGMLHPYYKTTTPTDENKTPSTQ
jgi:hypothetical protein